MTVTTEEVWKEFNHRLKSFILKRVQDESDAEDILQEVFIKIHSHIHTLRDQDRLAAWLYGITRNAIADHYRGQREVITVPADVLEGNPAEPVAPQVEEDMGSCLRPLIDLMPEKYGQAIVLTELEGLSQTAMAEKLELSISGAKSRVQRGREKIREMLAAGCNMEFDPLGNIADCWPK